jgi:ABC-type nitrate/sulfonate/bicarbonate transport system substrate-binding protein
MTTPAPRSAHRCSLSRRDVLRAAGTVAVWLGVGPGCASSGGPLRAIYPARSASSWSIFLAAETGLYRKHGLDVAFEFGVHPAGIAGLISGEVQFSNYSLDDVAAAAARDPALVVMGSALHRATFALLARQGITRVEELAGKRLGVGRVGDPTYHYTVALFKEYGLATDDVQWVPTGADASTRAAMLLGGQLDAALLTAPAWYALEAQGLAPLTQIEDHENISICTGFTFRRSWAAEHPGVVERILRAQSEAVHRFYTDRDAAVSAFRKYVPAASEADTARYYERVRERGVLDRIPLLEKSAATAAAERIAADVPAVRELDFQQIIDMRAVRKLIAEGFYETLYGPSIAPEQERKLQSSFA